MKDKILWIGSRRCKKTHRLGGSARWNPLACFGAALLFGGAGALGPALQSVGISKGYYLFYAAPYVLTLALLVATSSPDRALAGAPGELGLSR